MNSLDKLFTERYFKHRFWQHTWRPVPNTTFRDIDGTPQYIAKCACGKRKYRTGTP